MQALTEWVHSLSGAELPVLQKTVEDLGKLRGKEENLTARDLSQIVLRDPLMALKVLRFSQSRLTRRQPTEVTTVEHALMMHGLTAFFRETRNLIGLEQHLAARPAALNGAMRVISRACHAASYARNFGALRHDMDSDEVVTGALLHDLAELLLWCTAPAEAMQIDHMLSYQRSLRSAAAQRVCLGFALSDLQLALAREWKLPHLLQLLMDDQQANNARVRTVALSVALARHSAHGWYDAALPDDYLRLQKLLNLPPDGLQRWIRQSTLQASWTWQHTGIRPAAAWIPLLPGEWPTESSLPNQTRTPPEDGAGLVARVLGQCARVSRENGDEQAIVALVFYALDQGLGLRRLWFGRVNPKAQKLEPCQTLLLDPGLLPGDLGCELGSSHLLARLMAKTQGVWLGAGSRDKLSPLLPAHLREKLGGRDFLAMSLHVRGQPFGLFYADGGESKPQLDEQRYTAYKNLCLAAGQALERLAA
jgi:HD-like signal output (HDOD) protein